MPVDTTAPPGTQKTIKRWENNLEKIDIQRQSRDLNQHLVGRFMHDPLNYKPETSYSNADYWDKNEARLAHGYPYTAWLQLGIYYGAGLYTAKQQGLVAKGVIFSKFWNFHYFDWMTFIRRAGIYGVGGGLVLGTVLFGSPDLSINRVISTYRYWVMAE